MDQGDDDRIDAALPAFTELRAIAEREFRREPGDHTLQVTALVNEAWLRMAGKEGGFESRAHFLGYAAQAMRHVLVDHARRRRADKRGGEFARVTLQSGDGREPAAQPADVLDLHECLSRLRQEQPRQAQVVELRFFAGATIEEIAEVLGVSHMTVSEDWRRARVWLARELGG